MSMELIMATLSEVLRDNIQKSSNFAFMNRDSTGAQFAIAGGLFCLAEVVLTLAAVLLPRKKDDPTSS